MNAPRIAYLAAALVLTAFADLLAQEEPPVAPGDHVRVTAPDVFRGRLVGSVVTLGADTCVLEVEGRAEQLALPLTSLTRLEVSRGQSSMWAQGMGIGFLLGATLGAVVGLTAAESWDVGGEAAAAALAGLIGVPGAFVGLAVGASTKKERWESVPLDRLRVSMVPRRDGGLAIRVSLAF